MKKSIQNNRISLGITKRAFGFGLCFMAALGAQAQYFDLDQSRRRTAEVSADGFTSWMLPELPPNATDSRNYGQVEVCIKNTSKNHSVRTGWYKGQIAKDRLVNDGIHVDGVEAGKRSITVIIKGLPEGEHSLQAYHNNTDGLTNLSDIQVAVNGKKVASIPQSNREATRVSSAKSYVTFTGTTATIEYSCTTDFYINSLELDVPNADNMVSSPFPANNDIHADADGGTAHLQWKAAVNGADSQQLYWATDKQVLEHGGGTNIRLSATATSYDLTGLSPMQKYYWRIDVTKEGKTIQGQVWMFQPRRIAFPGAEGYGKYAIGGRGGDVYHVTSLSDEDKPGTFRYGVTHVNGPRTIVFDVAGVITLNSRLAVNAPFVTIAGQTAPGRGILFRSKALGVANDGITRFIRLRLGGGDQWTGTGANVNTMDGMGMAGNNHSIMDHCSIGWAIDEGFSSRNSQNLTLQHTLISEELNFAGHSHYVEQSNRYVEHGYAATIGGGSPEGVASYHHNLLAHNNGRNWSMGGGLLDGKYAGHLDLFNNVCYNWGSRATDGGAHEVNFVGNYYKMGPATTQPILLCADLEGTGGGSQSYYMSGNIRENLDQTKTTDQTALQKIRTKNKQKVDWEVFRNHSFFPSLAKVESAEAAYKNVLSDVGCNMPELDNHDVRMIDETLQGKTSTEGHYTHKKGLIDRESDSEGFEGLNIITASRPAGWDSDQDGMPDWWEKAYGTNPTVADNNGDKSGNHFTNLEEYLNWIAEPNFQIDGKAKIDLATYFRGYKKPVYTIVQADGEGIATVKGKKLVVKNNAHNQLFTVKVKAEEDGVSLVRSFNFYLK